MATCININTVALAIVVRAVRPWLVSKGKEVFTQLALLRVRSHITLNTGRNSRLSRCMRRATVPRKGQHERREASIDSSPRLPIRDGMPDR